jgi:hypothetical protein
MASLQKPGASADHQMANRLVSHVLANQLGAGGLPCLLDPDWWGTAGAFTG